MAVIMPGDAKVLKSYGFTENHLDPLRFKKRINNFVYTIHFRNEIGWRFSFINISNMKKMNEFYFKTLKEALDEFEKIAKEKSNESEIN